MASQVAETIDLICKRYPGRKPSDYLDIEDEYTAFQVDAALAIAGEYRDREQTMDYIDVINEHTLAIFKQLGGKVKNKQKRSRIHEQKEEVPLMKDLISQHMSRGGVFEK